MSVTIDGAALKKGTHAAAGLKKWTHNGVVVYVSSVGLADSSELQMGPGGYNTAGSHITYPESSVKWDCRGYSTLSFDLTYKVEFNCLDTYLIVYVRSTSGTAVGTVLNLNRAPFTSQTTVKCSVDISGLTESEKSAMYLSAEMYAHAPDWTGKYATLYCVASNVQCS